MEMTEEKGIYEFSITYLAAAWLALEHSQKGSHNHPAMLW